MTVLTDEVSVSPADRADAAERYDAEQTAIKRKTAGALMTASRVATDLDDFMALADCLSAIELTADQRRRLYDVMRQEPVDPQVRMMGFWEPMGAYFERRERETESILCTALEICLERFGEDGREFSVYTIMPLVPPYRRHLVTRAFRRMRDRIEPVDWEHPEGMRRVRTYRLAL